MLTPDAGFLDRRIAQEAVSLAGRGWAVDIYPSHAAIDPSLEMLAPGVSVLQRPAQPALGGARRAKRLLRRVSPRLHRIADIAQSSYTDRANQIASWNIGHLTSLEPYDAVFAHDIPALPLAVRLADAWGCAVICDLHEIYPQSDDGLRAPRIRTYWEGIERDYLPRTDGILCVNAAVEDYVVDRYAPSVPIGVVLNSVPYTAVQAGDGALHRLYGIPSEHRVLVFAGSFRTDTNLENAIIGFGRARLPGWALAILASGPRLEEMQQLVTAEGLTGTVFLGKRVPQHELIAVLASADVGVLPYQPVGLNHEISTPNKLFEYIQARLPIATERLPMIEPIIEANANGAFVDYSDPDAAARDLRRFVDEDITRFTPAILEAAARNVCWERDEPTVLRVFGEALERARGRREGSRLPPG
jgi:glycosyltransferase involved in cell wall biosynthesis